MKAVVMFGVVIFSSCADFHCMMEGLSCGRAQKLVEECKMKTGDEFDACESRRMAAESRCQSSKYCGGDVGSGASVHQRYP
jgi:hypothetical protein